MRSRSITSVLLAGPRVQTILALRRTGPGEGKISEAAMSNVSKDLIPCYQLCVAGDQLLDSTQQSVLRPLWQRRVAARAMTSLYSISRLGKISALNSDPI